MGDINILCAKVWGQIVQRPQAESFTLSDDSISPGATTSARDAKNIILSVEAILGTIYAGQGAAGLGDQLLFGRRTFFTIHHP